MQRNAPVSWKKTLIPLTVLEYREHGPRKLVLWLGRFWWNEPKARWIVVSMSRWTSSRGIRPFAIIPKRVSLHHATVDGRAYRSYCLVWGWRQREIKERKHS